MTVAEQTEYMIPPIFSAKRITQCQQGAVLSLMRLSFVSIKDIQVFVLLYLRKTLWAIRRRRSRRNL